MSPGAREVVTLAVVEPSQVGEARRAASALAGRLGFDTAGAGRVALLVAELANNLVHHARDGRIVLQGGEPARPGVEILAIDRGPGVADFGRCLTDGFTTRGTMGVGLGTVQRQADRLDWHSAPGEGTVIAARVDLPRRLDLSPPTPGRLAIDLSAICSPLAGETACGDAWAFEPLGARAGALLVADGLGHGPMAAQASSAAVAEFLRSPDRPPVAQVEAIHAALRGTRGAAVLVVRLDHDAGQVRAAGIGNIAASVVSGDSARGLVSHNGTVGAGTIRAQEFALPWPDGALLIAHSDGLSTHWRLPLGHPLRGKDPAVIAGALFRDHRRERDDATVVVARHGGRP